MPALPSGTVTFLFTDIEGSTSLLQDLGDFGYARVLSDHGRLLRAAFDTHGGHVIETQGDGYLVAFQSAHDAVLTAIEAQRTVVAHPWPEGAVVRVRMGLHTGEPLATSGGYVGLDVHRAARICQAGWGGQVLISQSTRELIALDSPEGATLRDLGAHRLKGLNRPEQIFQIVLPDLAAEFPPLRSLDSLPNNLPRQLTSFVGRAHQMADIRGLLAENRLVTLTGTGGCGKTRLALEIATDLLDTSRDGVWFVELALLSDPALVPQAVASVLGLREQPGRPIADTLEAYLAGRSQLLVLDNCEHLITACAHLAERLLKACPDLRILATSRERLRIPGEVAYLVPSLSLPDIERLPALDGLAGFEAIQLFVDRARTADPAFQVTHAGAPLLAHICHRLDGTARAPAKHHRLADRGLRLPGPPCDGINMVHTRHPPHDLDELHELARILVDQGNQEPRAVDGHVPRHPRQRLGGCDGAYCAPDEARCASRCAR